MTTNSLIKKIKKPRQQKAAVGSFYEILGVARDATTEEIRAAFRELMRQHHPDKNGGVQSPEFNRIKEAYDVLIDHKARQIYDLTGTHPDDKKTQIMAAALDGLRQCFAMILEQADPETLERCDLIGSIKKFIDLKIREETNALAHLKEHEKAARLSKKIIEKRLKCKSEKGVNMFVDVINARIANIVNKQIPLEGALAVKKEMLKILKTYDFDWIKENVSVASFSPVMAHTSTMTFLF